MRKQRRFKSIFRYLCASGNFEFTFPHPCAAAPTFKFAVHCPSATHTCKSNFDYAPAARNFKPNSATATRNFKPNSATATGNFESNSAPATETSVSARLSRETVFQRLEHDRG